jgi:hypothetical protein
MKGALQVPNFPFNVGMQFKLPYLKLVGDGYHAGGGPSTIEEECMQEWRPGGHWCYRLQL